MKIIKILSLSLLFCFSFFGVQAQEHYHLLYKNVQYYAEQLGLTETQLQQIEQVTIETEEIRLVLSKKRTEIGRKSYRLEMGKLEQLELEKLQAIYTAAQLNKYSILLKEEQVKMARSQYQIGIWAELGLTVEQIDQMIEASDEVYRSTLEGLEVLENEPVKVLNYEDIISEKYKAILTKEQWAAYKAELERSRFVSEEDVILSNMTKSLAVVEAMLFIMRRSRFLSTRFCVLVWNPK
jgi:hypothetical protein